jgi:hypothetical protein
MGFQKLPKVKKRPKGEYSANLVTLIRRPPKERLPRPKGEGVKNLAKKKFWQRRHRLLKEPVPQNSAYTCSFYTCKFCGFFRLSRHTRPELSAEI